MTLFIHTEGLYPKRIHRNTTNFDEYIKQHIGIDPAIIAFNKGITENFVRLRQRKLGIRFITTRIRKTTGIPNRRKP